MFIQLSMKLDIDNVCVFQVQIREIHHTDFQTQSGTNMQHPVYKHMYSTVDIYLIIYASVPFHTAVFQKICDVYTRTTIVVNVEAVGLLSRNLCERPLIILPASTTGPSFRPLATSGPLAAQVCMYQISYNTIILLMSDSHPLKNIL